MNMEAKSKLNPVIRTVVLLLMSFALLPNALAEEVDLASLYAPLRNKSLKLPERIDAFIKTKTEFDKKNSEKIGKGFFVDKGEKYSTEKINEAEKKAPVKLPAEYKILLHEIGSLEVDDSYFINPDFFGNAYDQMISDWGTPKEIMEKLPKEQVEYLKSRTILFTEVGDGLGGVLYGKDGYSFIHQDTMEPTPLKKSDGEDMDFADILFWIIHNYGGSLYEGTDQTITVIDSVAGYKNPEK